MGPRRPPAAAAALLGLAAAAAAVAAVAAAKDGGEGGKGGEWACVGGVWAQDGAPSEWPCDSKEEKVEETCSDTAQVRESHGVRRKTAPCGARRAAGPRVACVASPPD